MAVTVLTPGGKLTMPESWQALLVKGLPGYSFQRTPTTYSESGKHIADTSDKARAEDFVSQHPREAVSTMLYLFEEGLAHNPEGALRYVDRMMEMLTDQLPEEVPF